MMIIRRHLSWVLCAFAVFFVAQVAQSETSHLTIQSSPPGATVIINGKRLNVKTPVRVNVKPGQHQIRLEMEGYHPVTRTVEIYSGAGFASFTLKPLDPARAKNAARPASAPAAQPQPAPKPSRAKAPAPAKTSTPAGTPAPAPKPVPASAPTRAKAPAAPSVRAPEPADSGSDDDVRVTGEVKVLQHDSEPAPTAGDAPEETWNILPDDNPFSEWLDRRKKEEAAPQAAQEDYQEEAAEPIPEDIFPLVIKQEKPSAPAEPQVAAAEPDDNDEDISREEAEMMAADEEKITPEQLAAEEAEDGDLVDGASLEDKPDTRQRRDEPPIPAPAADAAPGADQWPLSAERVLYKEAANLPHFPEKFNVLLLGLDRRDRRGILATGAEIPVEVLKRKPANSDVIMVIQLDFLAKKVRIVSIPRDTKVYIRRHGNRKINAAYAYGRERLSRQIVSNFLDIPIHRTVVADWRGTKRCISLFKGLGLDYNGFSEKELFWHLRKRSFRRGDFRRIERQQTFMRYAMGEALRIYNDTRTAEGPTALVKKNLLDLALEQGLSVVETDLTPLEVNIIAYAFRDYDVRETEMAQVRGRGRLEGAEDGDGGVYFFTPTSHHSFDDIIARAYPAERSE